MFPIEGERSRTGPTFSENRKCARRHTQLTTRQSGSHSQTATYFVLQRWSLIFELAVTTSTQSSDGGPSFG
jgi:hypothetical protein